LPRNISIRSGNTSRGPEFTAFFEHYPATIDLETTCG
jgi:hypothetical protein